MLFFALYLPLCTIGILKPQVPPLQVVTQSVERIDACLLETRLFCMTGSELFRLSTVFSLFLSDRKSWGTILAE